MTISLNAAPVAVLAAGGPDDRELRHCWQAVLARRGTPVLVGHALAGGSADVRLPLAQPGDYRGLVLIGAQRIQDDPASGIAERFVRGFFALGLPVAASARATLGLASQDLVGGRVIAAVGPARPALAAAGAILTDRPVARCGNGPNILVSSRSAADLPVFCAAFTLAFSDHLAALAAAELRS